MLPMSHNLVVSYPIDNIIAPYTSCVESPDKNEYNIHQWNCQQQKVTIQAPTDICGTICFCSTGGKILLKFSASTLVI